MVFVAKAHSHSALNVCIHPTGIVGECSVVAVGLNVCLVGNVDSKLVAVVVEKIVLGVMTGADGVYVKGFCRQKLCAKLLRRNGTRGVGAELVKVCAANDKALAVEL